MSAVAKRVLKFETEWLCSYASAYDPNEEGFAFSERQLRQGRISLVELRNALRRCVVVYAEKLDIPGAMWIAEGPGDEQEQLRITLTVVSETMDVRLRAVERFRVESNVREEGPNDAA